MTVRRNPLVRVRMFRIVVWVTVSNFALPDRSPTVSLGDPSTPTLCSRAVGTGGGTSQFQSRFEAAGVAMNRREDFSLNKELYAARQVACAGETPTGSLFPRGGPPELLPNFLW